MPLRFPLFSIAFSLAAGSGVAAAAPGGIPDPTFGDHGFAWLALDGIEGHQLRAGAALTLPDGSLLLGGSRNLLVDGNPDPRMRAMLARMRADGTPDDTFNTNPALPGIRVMDDLVTGRAVQQIEALARLDDGTVLAAGSAQIFGPKTCFVIRLDANGARDMTFADGTGLASIPRAQCHAMVVDADGGIIVAGERSATATPNEAFLARFNANGLLDITFGQAGFAALAPRNDDESGYIGALAIGADGTLVAGGAYEAYGPGLGADFSLARFTANGQPDTSFDGTGWRARPYVKFSLPLREGGKTALVLSNETFINLNTTTFQRTEGLDRMRNLIAISTPLNKTITMEAGYLNQHGFVRNGEDTSDHVASVSLSLSL